MEFKIWGRLDENGRIQSVQSNCSGLNHDFGPLPYNCGDNLLSLNEKKKLVYQLDSKTDEMSILILQMSEMNKRIELQEKLLSEYENKFKRQQREVEQLRRENRFLRNKGATESSSSEGSCSPNSARVFQPVTTFEMTCNLKCKPFKYQSCPEMPTNSLPDADESSSTGTNSTSYSCGSAQSSSGEEIHSLDTVDGIVKERAKMFDNEIENTCSIKDSTGTNDKVVFDVEDACNPASNQTDESKLHNNDGYSFATNEEKGTSNVPNNRSSLTNILVNGKPSQEARGIDINTSVDRTSGTSAFHPPAPHGSSSSFDSLTSADTDKDGYLILDKPRVKQIAHEEIHGTWMSVNLKIQQSQFGTNTDVVDGRITPQRPTESEKDVCITTSRGSEEIVNVFVASSPQRTGLKHKTRPSHGYAEIDESMLDPRFQSQSEPSNVSLPVREEIRDRSPSADRSEDDVCNSYIKTMKTTMEWAKAKKGLLKESNEMTVEKVESVLRDTVQEIYAVLKRYESEKPYRMNKSVAEKAVAVQRKLRKSRVVDIISDDFLRKCVLVCSSRVS